MRARGRRDFCSLRVNTDVLLAWAGFNFINDPSVFASQIDPVCFVHERTDPAYFPQLASLQFSFMVFPVIGTRHCANILTLFTGFEDFFLLC